MVSLPKRFAELIPELAKFGLVGLVGSVVDLGGAAYLHGAVGIGPMVSKGLSIIAATVLTYLGSRFWTFRHRVNQALLREGVLFAGLNLVGLAIAECVIAFVTTGRHEGHLAYNAATCPVPGSGRSSSISRTRSGCSWPVPRLPWRLGKPRFQGRRRHRDSEGGRAGRTALAEQRWPGPWTSLVRGRLRAVVELLDTADARRR
jgi:putative flippase GtrA